MYARHLLEEARFAPQAAVAMCTELHIPYDAWQWTMIPLGEQVLILSFDPECDAVAAIAHQTIDMADLWGEDEELLVYA